MLSFEMSDEEGNAILRCESAGFTIGMARSPLLYRSMVESLAEKDVVLTANRSALLKSFCNIVATGAQFKEGVVSTCGNKETIKFSVSY